MNAEGLAERPTKNEYRLRLLVSLGITICLAALCWWMVSAGKLRSEKERAHQQCVVIKKAVDSWRMSSHSPGSPEVAERPLTPHDLAHPSWSTSFLPNGDADTIDPWGNPFQMEWSEASDGTQSVLIFTTAPDGTRISQYGIGENSQPR